MEDDLVDSFTGRFRFEDFDEILYKIQHIPWQSSL